jgi:excisionase family DNA binding protein
MNPTIEFNYKEVRDNLKNTGLKTGNIRSFSNYPINSFSNTHLNLSSTQTKNENEPVLNEKLLTRQRTSNIIPRIELAKLLNVTLGTLYNWTKSGKIKSYGIGGKVFYKLDEIESSLIRLNPGE